MYLRQLACTLVVVGLFAPVVTLVPEVSGQSAYGPELDLEESALLALINDHRASQGVSPLQASASLSAAAAWMAGDGAAHGLFSHVDSLGRDPCARLQAFGYPVSPTSILYQCAGASITENARWGGAGTAQDALAWWKQSPLHNQNILGAQFKVVGIGRASGPYGWVWFTDFGSALLASDLMDPGTVPPAPLVPPTPPVLDPDRERPLISLGVEGFPAVNPIQASRGDTLVIRADAVDNRAIQQVVVKVNGRLICDLDTAPFTCSWTIPLTEKAKFYTVRGRAVDTSNNQRLSAPVRIKVLD